MKSSQNTARLMLHAAVAVLILFNAVYWTGKFSPDTFPALTSLRTSLLAHWGLLMFLELLAVSSAFVDMVVRWDTFSASGRRWRLLLTVLLTGAFIARFGLGVLDMYMVSSPQ
jgi:Na+/H+ antiporter NhaD/arsenite permease-like protein